jgi:hypothetical protein
MQKSFVDKRRIPREFKIGEHVFMKVKPKNFSLNLGSWAKLAIIYCGPFETLDRIGHVSYMISLSTTIKFNNVFHVSFLKKYVHDPNHVVDWDSI